MERPIHRDAHPGQFIVGPDRALVIDVDTFATGDPAIDLGNYSAHLSLQGVEEVDEVLLAAYGAGRALRRRVEIWHTLSLLRLSLDGLLTTGRAKSAVRALERLK
ncbi:MAG: aminoglycoside phosphotransferase family protein [Actinobacteria bacterium]|nr:aminoglycoside phosphotransferase family protein [Actinomycetota bacterium]